MCKITELLDTIFFVLRKKDRQITFLHLYHHTLMPVCGFIGLKYFAGKMKQNVWQAQDIHDFISFFAGGHGTLLGLINSFIHVIMYMYYLLSAMGPQMQKYLWWKKYLTIMQIVSNPKAYIYFLDINFMDICWHLHLYCHIYSRILYIYIWIGNRNWTFFFLEKSDHYVIDSSNNKLDNECRRLNHCYCYHCIPE